MIQNLLSGIFVLPDFRGYYYIADCPLWPQRASYEVVFGVDALKMPVFEEILTNSGAWKKGEIHIWPLCKDRLKFCIDFASLKRKKGGFAKPPVYLPSSRSSRWR